MQSDNNERNIKHFFNQFGGIFFNKFPLWKWFFVLLSQTPTRGGIRPTWILTSSKLKIARKSEIK